MSNVKEFEKAIKQFGVDAALEYFDVPEEKKDFFRNGINTVALHLTANTPYSKNLLQSPQINSQPRSDDSGCCG